MKLFGMEIEGRGWTTTGLYENSNGLTAGVSVSTKEGGVLWVKDNVFKSWTLMLANSLLQKRVGKGSQMNVIMREVTKNVG